MINQAIMPKAYKEVYEIVKHLSEEDFNKIPKEIIKTLHSNMDKDYEFYIIFEDLQNQETLNETKLLLAIIFRDYLATEKQKEKIMAKERYDEQVYQEEMRKKYNPENFFKKQQSSLDKNKIQKETNVIEYKPNIFKKILSFFKRVFHK